MKPAIPYDLYLLLVVGLLSLGRRCASEPLRAALARAIGRLAYHSTPRKRRLALQALARVPGPPLRQDQARRIVQQSYAAFWLDLLALAPFPNEERLFGRVQTRGLEHLDWALERGRGAILWEHTHFGGRVAARRLLALRGYQLHQVHLEGHLEGFDRGRAPETWLSTRVVRPFFARCERLFLREVVWIPTSGSLAYLRTLQARLRENRVVCIAANGGTGEQALWVDLLGHREPFSTGALSLARLSGAALLPLFCYRARGSTRLVVEAPLPVSEGRDQAAAAQRYAALLEAAVRRYPGQYHGWHLLGQRRVEPARQAATARGGGPPFRG